MEAALGLEVAQLCQHGTAFWASKGQELNDRVHLRREKGLSKISRKCWSRQASLIVTERKTRLCAFNLAADSTAALTFGRMDEHPGFYHWLESSKNHWNSKIIILLWYIGACYSYWNEAHWLKLQLDWALKWSAQGSWKDSTSVVLCWLKRTVLLNLTERCSGMLGGGFCIFFFLSYLGRSYWLMFKRTVLELGILIIF